MSQFKKIFSRTAVVVAIIGLTGAIVTAVFNYLSTRSQTEIPIKATQTAENLLLRMTQTLSTPILDVSTKTPSVDWNTILRISPYYDICGYKVVPEFISLDPSDMQLSLASLSPEFSKQDGKDWHNALSTDLSFEMESFSQLNWIKVENRFFLNIFVESEVPDDLNVVYVYGCGGGSAITLSEVELDSQNNLSQYRIRLESPGIDFFTLQPGEFEFFQIPLVCKTPGIYSISIELFAEYIDQMSSPTIVPSTKIYCPYHYSYYSFGAPTNLNYEGKFEWNGSKYQSVP
jgi:hypothetical protein